MCDESDTQSYQMKNFTFSVSIPRTSRTFEEARRTLQNPASNKQRTAAFYSLSKIFEASDTSEEMRGKIAAIFKEEEKKGRVPNRTFVRMNDYRGPNGTLRDYVTRA